jgi:hypothetical protein
LAGNTIWQVEWQKLPLDKYRPHTFIQFHNGK